jgi:hypothetical protein
MEEHVLALAGVVFMCEPRLDAVLAVERMNFGDVATAELRFNR